MYAIVTTGGKQYRVEQGQSLLVERLPVDDGGKATLRPLLYVDGDSVVDGEDLAKVSVEARVVGHERGPKLRVVKFKPKRGYRRRTGHRQELTRIEVTQIKLAERRPAARRAPKAEAGVAAEPGVEEKAAAEGKAAPASEAGPAKAARRRAPAGDSPAKATRKPPARARASGEEAGETPAAEPPARRKPPSKPAKPEEGNGA